MPTLERTPTSVYRAGIIGCGRIADSIEDELVKSPAWSLLPYSHAGAYQRCPHTDLVAAADVNAGRLSEFGRRRGVERLYADYQEMLDREALDIVSICVPTRLHGRVALDVVERPIRGIYLEKPIAQSLGEARQMTAAFRSRKIKVAVNHVRTWDPTYAAVRHLVATGAIGAVRTVIAHLREGALFGGTHMYDLVRSLLRTEPEWVFGEVEAPTGTYDPGARGIIGFPGGVRVYLNCIDDPVQFELDMIGSEGRIRVGNGLYPELWQVDRSGPQRMLVRRGFPGVHDGRSGMLRAVEDLVRAIETGSKPASDDVDAQADLQIAVALHLSHRTGERVSLPVTADDYVIEDPWGRDR